METITLRGTDYEVLFRNDFHALTVKGGHFLDMFVQEGPLFSMRLKHIKTGEEQWVSSASHWSRVHTAMTAKNARFCFVEPCGLEGIEVNWQAERHENGLNWTGGVQNENGDWSVMELSYPVLTLAAEPFDLFVPRTSGIVIENAGKKGYSYRGKQGLSMQFFAAYKKDGGVYFAIHDPAPALKQYDIVAKDGNVSFSISYVGENGGLPHNSFLTAGACRWQTLHGDWYDASQIYAAFVRSEAEWLPHIDGTGRPDTAQKWKEIPFWVCDYIPNSERQRDNRPMSLAAGSDRHAPEYWYEAVIALQQELGVPIGYHVYNWHEIPFNVEYPHFLPAKSAFVEGMKKIRENGKISVVPYINSLSWETRDNADTPFETTFENTGRKGAVKLESGELKEVAYPQRHNDGKNVMLAYMCPSDSVWQKMMCSLVREIERDLDVDGIYFDQISATHGAPCYDTTHAHTPGGGRYWCDGYRRMIHKILKDKPQDAFYFSEDNAEEYMNLFDGFLTWRWLMNEEVPAFPAVYGGYILTLGRSTMGIKKEDKDFFKYSLAKSFLYGQQLGWCKADVLYDGERLPFLKTLVRERYRFSALFASGEMLRPPQVICSLPEKTTSPALSYKTEVVMEQVCAGAFRNRTNGETVLFVINVAKEESQYTLSFSNEEYGIAPSDLYAHGFSLDEAGRATLCSAIAPESIVSMEFPAKNQRG